MLPDFVQLRGWLEYTQEFYGLGIAASTMIYGDQMKNTVVPGAVESHAQADGHRGRLAL